MTEGTERTAMRIAADLYATLDRPEMRIPAARPSSGTPRRATRVHAPAPVDLDLLDYVDGCAAELRDHTLEHGGRCDDMPVPPPPADRSGLYDWAHEHTPVDGQPVLDAIVWRHTVEHTLRLDPADHRMIREQSCPTCGCWGLSWSREYRAVVCINRRCTTTEGVPVTWTLQQLAGHAIRRRPVSYTGN